jgi:hypothetical protein
MTSRVARLGGSMTALLCLVAVTGGCATSRMDLMPQHFGVRPDEPPPRADAQACDEYREYVAYAQRLQEAYHSRASQNRWWIYVAAITGLGAAAATGGLAAAGAAGVGTLALLGISGGFAAGTFGTLENTELAKMYTLSANSVDKALLRADAHLKGVAQVPAAEARLARLEKRRAAATEDAARASLDRAIERAKRAAELARAREEEARSGRPLCVDASLVLRRDVTRARTRLELLRTNTAAGALARAQEERKALDELIAQFPPPAAGATEDPEDTEPTP